MFVIKVDGMKCGGCAGSVKRAFAEADPQAIVEVDLTGHTLHVRSDRDDATIRSAIERDGYQVTH